MKVLKSTQQRLFIIAALIILQILIGFLVIFGLLQSLPILEKLLWFVSFLAVLYIINIDVDAGYKMIWILIILVFPYFGGIIYFVFGDKQPSKKLLQLYNVQLKQIFKYNSKYKKVENVNHLTIKSQLHYIENEGFPVYQNTKVKYYALGDVNYIDIIEDLKNAKHFIFMEYFIVEQGEMFDEIVTILKQKVEQGVEVRFMYDDFGSLFTLPSRYYKELQKYGIKCVAFNPLVPFLDFSMNNRDHRKITVIDGTIGYTGGINLADEYINVKERFGHWKDTGIRLEGEAVWNLTTMFLSSWNVSVQQNEEYSKYHPSNYDLVEYSNVGYIAPYGDSPLDESEVGQDVYLNIINQSREYLYIFTPYLILNETLSKALILACKRGVDVRIMTPGIPDKKTVFKVTRSYYPSLLEGGVKIYEYTPGFLHAKSFVCDDMVGVVGTINLDYRSLFLHFECGVYIYDNDVIKDIKEDFMLTLEVSNEITIDFAKKGKFHSFLGAMLRIFAPLL